MRVIISPAKKMNGEGHSLPYQNLPVFVDRAQEILEKLRTMTGPELKKLWACNDTIAELNLRRLEHMDLKKNLSPALLTYEGIQYQRMAPGIFTDGEFAYVQEHLRILSGFYGILRPFDGVVPYRLEMQAKLAVGDHGDLYAFWGERLAQELLKDNDCIINLASQEYSRAVSPYLKGQARFITCVFGERSGEKILEKGTRCKMARGEMVRFMAENAIEEPEKMQAFAGQGFHFSPENSDTETYVFIKE